MTQIQMNVQPESPVKPATSAIDAMRNMLRVAVPITYFAGIFPARSETFVYREVRELRRRGWDVSVVSLRESTDDDAESLSDLRRGRLVVYQGGMKQTAFGFLRELTKHFATTARTLFIGLADAIAPGEPIHWKDRPKLIGQAAAGIGVAGRLRDTSPRHIHCHFAHAPTTVGMYAAAQLKVPFSFTGHANDLFQRRILLKRKLERAAFVACISRWHAEFYRAIAPADDTVYEVIRCGVDVNSWNAVPAAGVEHAEVEKPLRVLTVCRLVEKKGVDTLIRALAGLRLSGGRGWKLTIAGEGPEQDRLRQLAAELGAGDKVEFLGAVGNEQVRNLLHSADVFALACRTDTAGDRDGIPVVLMEAMACGVPVVTGDLPAIRELVQDGISGRVVNANEPSEISQAIAELTENENLRNKLVEGGRSTVTSEFDLTGNVDRLERKIERMVGGARMAAVNRGVGAMKTTEAAVTNRGLPSRRYALITPCRDEAQYARRTLDSVTRQTVPPAIWVIVDDGSKDQTPQILAEYAAKFPYIKVVTRADRGDRKLGGGVIDAFYAGYETINPKDFEYVCKLDLDLDLPHRYFETLMERMEADPRIGTCSGKPYFVKDGKAISEMCGDENSVGMVKFYRTECFEQIGGFVRELMWDGIDCHRCRMLGWMAVSWEDSAIRFEHLRPMGTSHKNWWTGRVRHGVGQYFMGTGWSYMLASAVFRMSRPPLVVGGIAMLWGYLRSWKERKPRYGDAEFRRFLRTYQWDCLFRGKSRATESLNRRQSLVWNAARQPAGT